MTLLTLTRVPTGNYWCYGTILEVFLVATTISSLSNGVKAKHVVIFVFCASKLDENEELSFTDAMKLKSTMEMRTACRA